MVQDREPDAGSARAAADAADLAAWRHGDARAGEELCERHYAAVARFFHNKVSGAAQDDLVHETFLACLEGAASFRGHACFRTFLFGIAHRVLAGYVRRMARSSARRADCDELEELPASVCSIGPLAPLVADRQQRALLEALRRLPLVQQIALELHYWEDLTAGQIGEITGVPLGTAKSRLRDGRHALQAELAALASSPEPLHTTLDNLERWAGRVRAASGQPPARARVSSVVRPG